MRTKTMLATAALVAAGVASSMAQSNVYSLNVVGYINIPLTNGFNLIANQLDADGTGTNNTIQGVFGTPTQNLNVYKFTGGGFNTEVIYGTRSGWVGNASLNPGEACFVLVGTPYTLTVVGQVLQGSLTNGNVANPGGAFSFLSSIAPVGGTIDASIASGGLGYTSIGGAGGDTVYLWDPLAPYGTGNGSTPNYDNYSNGRSGWTPSDPVVPVGAGFFLLTSQTSWVQNFTVQ